RGWKASRRCCFVTGHLSNQPGRDSEDRRCLYNCRRKSCVWKVAATIERCFEPLPVRGGHSETRDPPTPRALTIPLGRPNVAPFTLPRVQSSLEFRNSKKDVELPQHPISTSA